jgi:hypothetical protein
MPYSLTIFGQTKTDPSKKIIFEFAYSYESTGKNSASSYNLVPGFSIRPINELKIGLTANFADNHNRLQYITTMDFLDEKRYILGTIDQKTLGLTFRVDLNLTPEFSIQYYGSPFVSSGSYSELKHVTDPVARGYNDRFTIYNNPQLIGNTYGLDENGDLLVDYNIRNPDFSFYQFRSNLVAKWEYRLGSFIYLVWSGERTGNTSYSGSSVNDSFRQLQSVFPKNIFLIKLNYWFSL